MDTQSESGSNSESGLIRLCVLGSTGSIGTQTLDIVREHSDRYEIASLSAHSSANLLIRQALEFRPHRVAIGDAELGRTVSEALTPHGIEVLVGGAGMVEVASDDSIHVVVAAIVGFAGLRPVLAALKAGHRVALANKETLVVAGSIVADLARASRGSIVPVDSEHSAIFQCLQGERPADVSSLILTASGGPFRDRPVDTFPDITKAEALAHPNWEMGAKITIDSATMMNKGLEVIEARWLFNVPGQSIRVLVHPQSIIHSMVEFVDGSTKAQLGIPDMTVPIQYALTYPERLRSTTAAVDWSEIRSLTFEEVSPARFPCLELAFEALRTGGSSPAVLNGANEAAVALFLADKIRFVDIADSVAYALARADFDAAPDLASLDEIDAAARILATEHRPRALH